MSIANKLMLIDSLAFNGIQTFTNMKVTEYTVTVFLPFTTVLRLLCRRTQW